MEVHAGTRRVDHPAQPKCRLTEAPSSPPFKLISEGRGADRLELIRPSKLSMLLPGRSLPAILQP
jgi:hypothetical protein